MTQPIAFTNVRVWDGSDLVDGPLVVRDGVIESIGVPETPRDNAREMDGRGGVIVPGLIDAHFHAFAATLDLETMPDALSYVTLVAAKRLGAALRRGFTSVRDVAGGDWGLSAALEEGLLTGPRYFYSGRALSQTGGHGDPRGAHVDGGCCARTHLSEVVDGVDAVRVAVRDRARTGSHVIKLLLSGGVVSPTDPLRVPQYSSVEVEAACEEANMRGLYVAAHAYSPEAILHATRHGVRTIEHGNLLDDSSAKEMASREVFLVPTLAAYDAMDRRGEEVGLNPVARAKNKEVLNQGVGAVRIAQRAGVKVGWGSDLMGELENDQLRGLQLQAEAMTPRDLLQSVTSVNAEILRRPDLGVLRVGAAADLLVLPGNPLEDPSVLWTEHPERVVVARGRIV